MDCASIYLEDLPNVDTYSRILRMMNRYLLKKSPRVLQLNKENCFDNEAPFLDSNLSISKGIFTLTFCKSGFDKTSRGESTKRTNYIKAEVDKSIEVNSAL